jgi:L-asparaginase/Glu-tRNA(Gln) amidotransferase subunit D
MENNVKEEKNVVSDLSKIGPRVLVLYTGGTIGMKVNDKNGM